MKIRLTGTAGECGAVVEVLRAVDGLAVLEVLGAYANRGGSRQVRVYVEARVDVTTESAP